MQHCPLIFLTTVRPVTLHTWPLGELCIPPGGPRQESPRRLASLVTSNRDDSLFLCDRCCLSPVCCINLPANETYICCTASYYFSWAFRQKTALITVQTIPHGKLSLSTYADMRPNIQMLWKQCALGVSGWYTSGLNMLIAVVLRQSLTSKTNFFPSVTLIRLHQVRFLSIWVKVCVF